MLGKRLIHQLTMIKVNASALATSPKHVSGVMYWDWKYYTVVCCVCMWKRE